MADETDKRGKRAAGSEADPRIGSVLAGRYRLDTLLGRGAMGSVYSAEHVLMHKPLAVKVLHAEHSKNPETLARFEREATAAANIEHPNVVAATDFGKLEDGTAYLALELVQGKNLRAEVAGGPLGLRRALHIARQVAAGLAAAHARSIVHRDLKPENVVLVEKDGDPDFVKILDFGIAKLANAGKNPLTQVGVVLGTLDYMAPEQALGRPVDARADLYSLGAMTYEMLSGQCPYEGESSSAILELQLSKPPPSLSSRAPGLAVPAAVEALVMKLLAKDPAARPPSAAAVAEELAKLASSLPAGAAQSPPPSLKRPNAPVVNKPTFLPSDPLPSFTFPPVEEAAKNLGKEVQQAIAAQRAAATAPVAPPRPVSVPAPLPAPLSPPSVPAPLPIVAAAAPLPAPAPLPEPASQLPAPSAPPAAPRVPFAKRVRDAIQTATYWIDDHRRDLPAALRRPLRRVPSIVILAILAGTVVVFALAILLLATRGETDASPAPSASAALSAAPPPPPQAGPSPSAQQSAAALASADAEKKKGNWIGMVIAVEEALAADPSLKDDERVKLLLLEGARHGASENKAFKLLTGSMGEKGAEVVYDLAAHPKTPTDLRVRAEEWLGTEEFRRVAPPALAIAGRLRAARGCTDKRALLETAGTTGDRRALEYLKVLALTNGCGRRGRDDCFPCLREGTALTDALAALEKRVGT